MGTDFTGSFVTSLFFITKQTATAMNAVITDDRPPLTHTASKTARGHGKNTTLNKPTYHKTGAEINFRLSGNL